MLHYLWRYCPLCKAAVKYKPEQYEPREKMSRELDIRMYEHQENLCSHCIKIFATCDGDPKFGNCVGNDNVIECESYKGKEKP